jgi:hypothetical protein
MLICILLLPAMILGLGAYEQWRIQDWIKGGAIS